MAGKKTILFVAALSACLTSLAHAQCDTGASYAVGGGGCSGTAPGWQNDWHKFRTECALGHARNSVWPLPFNCRDRSLYHQILQVNFDSGWEYACTLTDIHFDSETHKLNRAGESKVSMIMQTVPHHRRSIFVYQSDADSIDTRIAAVRNVINRWYSHIGETQVAATQLWPQYSDGPYIQTLNENYIQSLPAPVLNASIGGSIEDQ